MRKIAVLDQQTIDKIAAGEVVERPSSVVKELVENAIDAGATAVTVEITDGGKKLIRITDNGSGMEADQVPVAFLSHATSKIQKVEDLETISSLGFRGEALSSIAAVSQVELITKTPSALSGTRYVIEGGVEQKIEEMGAPEGTTFLVRNLFYNTPARSKFLKADATEANYIGTLMEQLALSHPEISFKYIQNRQVKLHTSGNYSVKDVIYNVYGRDIARALLTVSYENDFMKISGFAGKPEISRGNRSFENYYVNGRFVKNNIITKGIEDAYKGFLMQHKFPFVSLHIQMTGNDLDVNVHPRKLEVRFARGTEVYDAVYEAVRKVLTHRELIPVVPVGKEEKEEKEKVSVGAVPEPFEQKRRREEGYGSPFGYSSGEERKSTFSGVREEQNYGTFTPEEEKMFAGNLSQKPQGFEKPQQKDISSQTSLENNSINIENGAFSTETAAGSYGNRPSDMAAAVNKMLNAGKKDVSEEMGIASAETGTASSETGIASSETETDFAGDIVSDTASDEKAPSAMPLSPAASREAVPKAEKPQQLELFGEKLLAPESRSRHKLIGQLFETYWLVEFEDNFYIIDQHAAHEKVNYERFVKQFQEQTIESQILSPPMIVTLSLEEESRLNANLKFFQDFGFEIEPFGGREYCISAVPTNLYGFDEAELFLEMLDNLAGEGEKNTIDVFTTRLATMACKAAVKGNNYLSFQEADRLIDELLKLDNPYNCPHGRPTIIAMTKTEIEKKFKRIV